MPPLNLTQYAALLLRVYALEEQLRANPPKDPAAYLALVAQIEQLWNEADALLKQGGITEDQIRELREQAHAANQQRSRDDAPAPFPYNDLLHASPDEGRLKSGDEIYGNDPDNPTQWIVWGGFGHQPGGLGWHLLKTMP